MALHHASGAAGRPQAGAIHQPRLTTRHSHRSQHRASRTTTRFISSAHGRFAQALSQNGIAWQYKPRTFSIDWDAEGNLQDSITPDFYLPEYRQYLELTAPEEHCIAA